MKDATGAAAWKDESWKDDPHLHHSKADGAFCCSVARPCAEHVTNRNRWGYFCCTGGSPCKRHARAAG